MRPAWEGNGTQRDQLSARASEGTRTEEAGQPVPTPRRPLATQPQLHSRPPSSGARCLWSLGRRRALHPGQPWWSQLGPVCSACPWSSRRAWHVPMMRGEAGGARGAARGPEPDSAGAVTPRPWGQQPRADGRARESAAESMAQAEGWGLRRGQAGERAKVCGRQRQRRAHCVQAESGFCPLLPRLRVQGPCVNFFFQTRQGHLAVIC